MPSIYIRISSFRHSAAPSSQTGKILRSALLRVDMSWIVFKMH